MDWVGLVRLGLSHDNLHPAFCQARNCEVSICKKMWALKLRALNLRFARNCELWILNLQETASFETVSFEFAICKKLWALNFESLLYSICLFAATHHAKCVSLKREDPEELLRLINWSLLSDNVFAKREMNKDGPFHDRLIFFLNFEFWILIKSRNC